ncbi:hypothetical protein SAMN04487818_107127 [Actinokineospora terrae]|uniref:Uncharacterized protein n=1 Tax=Actinokineospora terrae TaxID=155974 RepID=A0A1H9UBG8_9PSEU|nr:hypothetical protein SAMN04487818_107127 [Actinokineospora terrae]
MRVRYRPGRWVAVTGPRTWLLVDADPDAPLVARCWALARAGADELELVGAIAAAGLRTVGGFAAAGYADGTGQVIVHGPTTVTLTSTDGTPPHPHRHPRHHLSRNPPGLGPGDHHPLRPHRGRPSPPPGRGRGPGRRPDHRPHPANACPTRRGHTPGGRSRACGGCRAGARPRAGTRPCAGSSRRAVTRARPRRRTRGDHQPAAHLRPRDTHRACGGPGIRSAGGIPVACDVPGIC